MDDFNIMGPVEMVMKAKEELKSMFEMKDVGEMDEYIGCQIKRNKVKRTMKSTQPVKVQRIQDEYDQGITKGTPNTPMEPGSVLKKEGNGLMDNILSRAAQKMYRSATAMLLQMMRWSRPEVMNGVREYSRFMTEARESHNIALQRLMMNILETKNGGLVLAPYGLWDGGRNFVFHIRGLSDSDYVKDESRHNVNKRTT